MSQTDGATKTIAGHTYKVLMLDPLIASDILVDLGKTLGPALGALGQSLLKSENTKEAFRQLMDGVKKGEEEGSLDNNAKGAIGDLLGDSLEGAMIGLVDRVEKHKLREIITTMAEVTSVELKPGEWPGLPSIFTVHFRGRVGAMYKWLGFALRVQYGGFF